MKTPTKIFLCLIIALSLFLRLYKLDSNPPALSWDEASAGYNGWTIANYGRDEWGQMLPLVFTSFKVDMNPVWIYAISISEKIFGLSEFSTRLPSALFGVFNVVLLFYLGRLIFKSDSIGLLAALSLAVSPFNLQFSRGAWEANTALMFFLLGLFLFLSSFLNEKLSKSAKSLYLVLAYACFGIDIFTYQAAKIVAPLTLILLNILFFKQLLRNKKALTLGIFIFAIFIAVVLVNPRLSGTARAAQSKFSDDQVRSTAWYKKTKDYNLGYTQLVLNQYLWHFEPKFLFELGDKDSKRSVQMVGEFYWVDLPFILLGLLFLLLKRSKISLLLLGWLILAPIPSALVQESPQAHRSLFLMGSMHLLIGLGAGSLILLMRKKKLQVVGIILYLAILVVPVSKYLNYYYTSYAKNNGIAWQYGMKQIVEYVYAHPEYNGVFMTNVRAQPYIFFLYYLKTPLRDFTDSVVYNSKGTEGQSLVDSFGKYHFNNWDPLNCPLYPDVLCIVSANEFGGQHAPALLKTKEIVKYPNGEIAFYIISTD